MTSTSSPAPPPAPRLSARSTRLPLDSLEAEPLPFHALMAPLGGSACPVLLAPKDSSPSMPPAPILASVLTRRTPPQAVRNAPHSPSLSPELSPAPSVTFPATSPPSPSLAVAAPRAPPAVSSRHEAAVVQPTAPPSPSLSPSPSPSPAAIRALAASPITAPAPAPSAHASMPLDHFVPASVSTSTALQTKPASRKRTRSPVTSRSPAASSTGVDELFAVPTMDEPGLKRARRDVAITARVEFRVVTVLRQSVSLAMFRDHDVNHIKALLSPATGMPVDAITLLLNGKELSDELPVREAGITTGTILLAKFKASSTRFSVVAKSLTGAVLARVDMSPQETVLSLKDMIACRASLAASRMVLMHGGKALPANDTRLTQVLTPGQSTVLVLPK